MLKIIFISAALLAGLTTAASAKDTLQLGVQGRPHGGSTPGRMLLYRSHLTRAQYDHMRMTHRRLHVR